jgi:ferric-dicitrate binding protein FerR (iron transport regulator)
MKTPEHIQQLLVRQIWNDLSAQEESELLSWRRLSEENERFFRRATDRQELRAAMERMRAEEDGIVSSILERYARQHGEPAPAHSRVYRLLRTAAIAVVSAGVTLYLLLGIDIGKIPDNRPAPAGHQAEFSGRGGLATALDDMHRGFRDGYAAGNLSRHSGIPVFFALTDSAARGDQYNTLRTLKGGRFCLQLPDGTRAWLNENSSVTWPANYSVDSERISVRGEVYVELTENKSDLVSFRVTAGTRQVSAIRGRFNIRAYPGDTLTLTAIDGDLLLDTAAAAVPVLLHPLQQARLFNGRMSISGNADLLKVLDWKIRKQ